MINFLEMIMMKHKHTPKIVDNNLVANSINQGMIIHKHPMVLLLSYINRVITSVEYHLSF